MTFRKLEHAQRHERTRASTPPLCPTRTGLAELTHRPALLARLSRRHVRASLHVRRVRQDLRTAVSLRPRGTRF